jgi:hypothetical protein
MLTNLTYSFRHLVVQALDDFFSVSTRDVGVDLLHFLRFLRRRRSACRAPLEVTSQHIFCSSCCRAFIRRALATLSQL